MYRNSAEEIEEDLRHQKLQSNMMSDRLLVLESELEQERYIEKMKISLGRLLIRFRNIQETSRKIQNQAR
jgi:hypothetical protein